MSVRALTLVALAATLSLTACRQRPLPAVDAAPLGFWRFSAESPGGELPFFVELTREDDRLVANLVNGEERVPSDRVSFEDRDLTIHFDAHNSRIRVSLENGLLVGALTVLRSGGVRQLMPVRATPGRADRFAATEGEPLVNVTGRWRVVFRQANGTETPAVGEFRQAGHELAGTFLTPSGDYRYLAGAVSGDRVSLSTFDGYHAFLFDARAEGDSVMKGDFWSGTQWHETWKAVRDENAALPDANALTYLKRGSGALNFAFPDTTGELVSLADARFEGKVVVVSISATWCPNCHDEAAFWAPYYRENRERGVEIVALMYEHVDEFETAVQQIRAFSRRHGIEYPMLIAGGSEKTAAHRTLPMLNHVMAFPTTLFVDRLGVVRRIHTGFSGPGTGEHHEKLTTEFSDNVDFLLAETPAQ